MSENNFYNALLSVQKSLKAPKNQYNKFGNYSYRSNEDILEAVKPLLADAGLVLNVSDEIVLTGERFYVKATATVTDGKTSVMSTAYAREEDVKKGMDASQITGSASSYARKYALNGLFLIDDTRDADTMDNGTKPETRAKSVTGTETRAKAATASEPKQKAAKSAPYSFPKEGTVQFGNIISKMKGGDIVWEDVLKYYKATDEDAALVQRYLDN